MAVETGNVSEEEMARRSAAAIAEKYGAQVVAATPAAASPTPEGDDDGASQSGMVDDSAARAAASDFAAQVGGVETVKAELPGRTFPIRGILFHLVNELPGDLLLELAELQDPRVEAYSKARVFREGIYACVIPSEHEMLRTTLRTSTPPVGIEEFNQMAKDLLEAVVGRPTLQP